MVNFGDRFSYCAHKFMLMRLLLCFILLPLVDLTQVFWCPTRDVGSMKEAKEVSVDCNVSCSSC